MADFYRHIESAEVSDDTDAKDLDIAVACHDDFRHCTHANGISPHLVIHTVFSWSLECGALYTHINAMHYTDVLLFCYLIGQRNQFVVVSLVHIRKAGARREIPSVQRMFREHIDVVSDDHQVANPELWIHTSGGIGNEQRLDAQFVHHPNRKGNFFHPISFIEMETPFHGHDVLAAEFAENQLPGMSLYCRDRKVGYVVIREFVAVSYL